MLPLSRRTVAVLLAVLCGSAGYASAQFIRGGGGFGTAQMVPPEMPDRNFAVCRIMFNTVRGGYWAGAGWRTDVQGEKNLSIRLFETA